MTPGSEVLVNLNGGIRETFCEDGKNGVKMLDQVWVSKGSSGDLPAFRRANGTKRDCGDSMRANVEARVEREGNVGYPTK